MTLYKLRIITCGGNQAFRRQTDSRSVKTRTGQLADMFALNFGVYYRYKCDFGKMTQFVHC